MQRTAIRSDGTLSLGLDAARLGFAPGALVDVIVTSAGTLILRIDDKPVLDVPSKPLPPPKPRTMLGTPHSGAVAMGRTTTYPGEPVGIKTTTSEITEAASCVQVSPADPGHRTSTGRRHWSDESRYRMAARKLGISLDDYRRRVQAGLKWCSRCKRWQLRSEFGPHKRRPDGLDSVCLESSRAAARKWQRTHYVPVADRRPV